MSKKKVLTVMLTLLVAVCLLATSALAVAPTGSTTDPTTTPSTTPTTTPSTTPSGTPIPGKPVFGDITKDAWYYDAVIWAVDNNVTVGTSATTFSPAKACTRAEMIEFVWNAAGQPKAETTKTVPFTDVPESGSSAFWYEDALLWAYENEIVAGTNEDGTTFSPTRVCTRAEMVSFLVRLLAENGDELDVPPFTDIQEDDWYYMEVLWAYTYGLTDGTSETTFSPLKTCTRAEAVQFLFNAAEVA